MDEQTIWGLFLILYIVPFGVWYSIMEIRQKSYLGRESEKALGNRTLDAISLMWCGGLISALAAWFAGWRPVGVALFLSLIFAMAFACRAAVKRWDLLRKPLFRYWVAGSAIWVLGVIGWFFVFGRVSALRDEEFILLAVVPPVVLAMALLAWRWARAKP